MIYHLLMRHGYSRFRLSMTKMYIGIRQPRSVQGKVERYYKSELLSTINTKVQWMCGVRFQTLDARHDWAITPSRVWTLDHIWRNYRHLGSPYKIHSDQGIWALSTKAAVFTYYLSHPVISSVIPEFFQCDMFTSSLTSFDFML